MQSILHRLRYKFLQSVVTTRVLKIPVSIYRRFIYHYGPDRASISVPDGPSAKLYSETAEEIRHFYPVYGELDNLSMLIGDLQDEDIFYDIGAHVGIYSCFVAKVIGGGQVFSFEPHPKNASRIHENAELNDIAGISVYQRGLSDSTKTAEISIDADEPGAVGHTDPSIRDQQATVDFVRGKEFVVENDLPNPTIIKIDIEGAELTALRGLEGVLDDCRVIYCEMSDQIERYGDSRSDLMDWLDDHGFRIQPLGEGGVEHENIRAVRR